MAKIDHFVGGLTTDETKECAQACLEQLPKEDAWDLIKQWIVENDFQDEAAALASED